MVFKVGAVPPQEDHYGTSEKIRKKNRKNRIYYFSVKIINAENTFVNNFLLQKKCNNY